MTGILTTERISGRISLIERWVPRWPPASVPFHNNSGSAQAFSNFRKFGIGNNWNNGNPIFLADGKHISGKAAPATIKSTFSLCCRSNEPLNSRAATIALMPIIPLPLESFRARRISLRSSSNGRPEAAMSLHRLHWLLKLPGGPLKDGSPYHPAQSAQWQLFHQSSVLAISTKIPHFRIMEIKSIKNRIKLGKSRKGTFRLDGYPIICQLYPGVLLHLLRCGSFQQHHRGFPC